LLSFAQTNSRNFLSHYFPQKAFIFKTTRDILCIHRDQFAKFLIS